MAKDQPQGRKAATPPVRKVVKASLSVDVALHSRWAAAAALRGMDRNAFAVEALTEAVRGLVIIDRRKSAGRVESSQEVESAGPE